MCAYLYISTEPGQVEGPCLHIVFLILFIQLHISLRNIYFWTVTICKQFYTQDFKHEQDNPMRESSNINLHFTDEKLIVCWIDWLHENPYPGHILPKRHFLLFNSCWSFRSFMSWQNVHSPTKSRKRRLCTLQSLHPAFILLP